MARITRFEDIQAWQTARVLTRRIYAVSREGEFARDYGLRDQMQRAAVSIMSNIAEGFESRTQAQFINHLGLAKASAGELRAQLYVALDVTYLQQTEFEALFDLTDKCSRQLSRFIDYLQTHPDRRRLRENRVEYEL